MFCRKGVLRNFAKLTGNHLCQSLFLKKLQAEDLRLSCEFCKISKNSFFHRTPAVAASVFLLTLQEELTEINC